MNFMMFNGLLLFLLFMWTSAEMGPETEHDGVLRLYANETRVDIQTRRRACRKLGGKCIKKKKDCPPCWPQETKLGRPYCSKRRRCCYSGVQTPKQNCHQTDAKGNKCWAYEKKPGIWIPNVCDWYNRIGNEWGKNFCYIKKENGYKVKSDCKKKQTCTLNGKTCVKHEDQKAECDFWGKDYQWCYTSATSCKKNWFYCAGGCPHWRFKKNHVCSTCDTDKDAEKFSKGREYEEWNTVFSSKDITINYSNLKDLPAVCSIKNFVKTWVKCIYHPNDETWVCPPAKCCTATSTIDWGHLETPSCRDLPKSGNCKDVVP